MSFEPNMTPAQAKQHQAWKEARERLRAPETLRPRLVVSNPEPEVAAIVIPADPIAELMDFITAAVANVAGLPVNQLISGPPTAEIRSARNLALGLCAKRLRLDRRTVAKHFEVTPRAVAAAGRALDPILAALCISNKTPIELSLPSIWGQWGKETDYPKISEVIAAVCERWCVSKQDLLSARRNAEYVIARHAAIALAKRLTLKSMLEIARRVGGKDHTTIMYAVSKFEPIIASVEKKLPTNATVFDWADAVCTELDITPLADGKRRGKAARV